MCANLSEVKLDNAAAGIEHAIDLQSQVQRPNHNATVTVILLRSTLTLWRRAAKVIAPFSCVM